MLSKLGWILSGGWAKNYRTQLVGLVTALVGILTALQNWALGDASFVDLLKSIGENWGPIVAGLAIWFAGDKVNAAVGTPTLLDKK